MPDPSIVSTNRRGEAQPALERCCALHHAIPCSFISQQLTDILGRPPLVRPSPSESHPCPSQTRGTARAGASSAPRTRGAGTERRRGGGGRQGTRRRGRRGWQGRPGRAVTTDLCRAWQGSRGRRRAAWQRRRPAPAVAGDSDHRPALVRGAWSCDAGGTGCGASCRSQRARLGRWSKKAAECLTRVAADPWRLGREIAGLDSEGGGEAVAGPEPGSAS